MAGPGSAGLNGWAGMRLNEWLDCILLGVTHEEVMRMYNHSGLIVE